MKSLVSNISFSNAVLEIYASDPNSGGTPLGSSIAKSFTFENSNVTEFVPFLFESPVTVVNYIFFIKIVGGSSPDSDFGNIYLLSAEGSVVNPYPVWAVQIYGS